MSTVVPEDKGWIKALAIISLVIGAIAFPASLLGCGLIIFPLIAVILGLITYLLARKSNSAQSTKVMALVGAILGGLHLLISGLLAATSLVLWSAGQ